MRDFIILLSFCLFLLSASAWPYRNSTNVTTYLNNLTNTTNYESFVGYVNVTSNGSNFFYQLVSANNTPLTDQSKPLLVWLQGGPGCSSLFGMYTEIGPFITVLDSNNKTKLNVNLLTYALDNHLLFVEQPIGVGFSTINNNDTAPRYATDAALHFETFMMNFFQIYPYLANNNLYLIGESYAGHYIPSFATRIIQNQATNKLPPLQGIIIGDGWTDPERQLMGYDSYAYSIGLITKNRRVDYKNAQNNILQDIIGGQYYNASGLFDYITGSDNNSIPTIAGNVNIYNYRQYVNSNAIDPLSQWVNSSEFKGNCSIYPNTTTWLSCNDTMYKDFYYDISQSYKANISYLLNNTRVLLYNGQNDIIVNTPSAESWIHSLDWEKSSDFLQTQKINWMVNNKVVGTVKQLNPLTFVYVKNAGHMVPTDQPVNTLDMMRRWLNNDTVWN